MLSLLEPTGGDSVAFLVLQQLLRSLHELVAHVTLKHPGDEVYLQVALKHVLRLADKVAKNALEPWKDRSWVYRCMGQRDRRAGAGPRSPFFTPHPSLHPSKCCSLRLCVKEVTALEAMSHAPSFHPRLGADQAKRNVPGPSICFQHHS